MWTYSLVTRLVSASESETRRELTPRQRETELKIFTDVYYRPGNIDSQYNVCVCYVCGYVCEWVLLIWWKKFWVSNVGDGWGVDVIGSSTERGVWKQHALHFLRQHNPWWQLSYCHGNECHLVDAMLIYTLGSTLKWLAWSYCMTHLRARL